MEILGVVSVPTYILVAVVTGLFTYWRYRNKYSHFSSQGVPGPLPLPYFGTGYLLFTTGLNQSVKKLSKEYGKNIGLYERGCATLLTSDTEILREVMVKDFSTFPNRRSVSTGDEILGNMMTSLKDDAWKRVRSLLTPTFSTGKLKQIGSGVNECVSVFVDNLGKLADKGEDVELRGICGNFTLDVIAKTGFGIDVNSQNDPESDFVKNAQKINDFKMTNPVIILAFLFPWTLPIFKKCGITLSFFDKGLQRYFIQMVEQIVNSRKAGDMSRQDFMQLMVNAHSDKVDVSEVAKELEEDGITFEEKDIKHKGLSTIELLAQGLQFFLAGFDNTAGVLAVFLHILACHPEIQAKVQQEVDEVLSGKDDIPYTDLHKLVYLDQCLQESLRLYPPAGRVERVITKDVNLKGIFMPKDSIIGINILGCHMNPDVWPKPEVFNPDRFTPEEKARRDTYDHIPFGYGPRNCIAMRLALMEIKMSAAMLLKHFTFVRCEKTKYPLTFHKIGILKVPDGIWVKVQRR